MHFDIEQNLAKLTILLPKTLPLTYEITDVKVGEESRAEELSLSGRTPARHVRQCRKQEPDRPVAFRLQRLEQPVNPLLACRSNIAITHDPESVRSKDKVERRNSIFISLTDDNLCRIHLNHLLVTTPGNEVKDTFRQKGTFNPNLSQFKERQQFVIQRYLPFDR